MSASEALSTPPPVSHLPPELWLHILYFATHVPSALDICPADPFDLPPPPSQQDIQRSLTHSLITKRYVVLVCRQWYCAAISYLYSNIVLNTGQAVLSLCKTLLHSEAQADSSPSADRGHPLGWYAKRIDVIMHDSQTHHRQGEEQERVSLCDILRCLPNLTIFIAHVRSRCWEASDVARCLAATSGPSLRYIQWVNRTFINHICPDQESWQALLLACPRLCALEVPACKSRVHFLLPDSSPNLSSLVLVGGPLGTTVPAYLPHLLSLKFHPAPFKVSTLKHTLSAYGRHLITLTIHINALDSLVLSDLCPSLKHLVLCIHEWEDVPDGLELPSSITHLGLCFDEQRPRPRYYAAAFTRLSTMVAPSIVVLRILSRHPLLRDYCSRFAAVGRGLKALRLAGYRLEDRDGWVLT